MSSSAEALILQPDVAVWAGERRAVERQGSDIAVGAERGTPLEDAGRLPRLAVPHLGIGEVALADKPSDDERSHDKGQPAEHGPALVRGAPPRRRCRQVTPGAESWRRRLWARRSHVGPVGGRHSRQRLWRGGQATSFTRPGDGINCYLLMNTDLTIWTEPEGARVEEP